MFEQMQCGFRKGFSTHQCLLAMLEKWKRSVDNRKTFGASLTHLSKAFEGFWLIAKLNAYDFSLTALKLVHNYLSNRKQRTKINSTHSSLLEVLFGVSQRSILGPLLFNIFLIDLFFIIEDTDIASYADGNTPCIIADNIDGWKLMKINADKCHLLVSTNNNIKIKIENFNITNSKSDKVLGVKFDHKLSFDDHNSELCKKASRKIQALPTVAYEYFKKTYSYKCAL